MFREINGYIVTLSLAVLLALAPGALQAKIQGWFDAGLEELGNGNYEKAIYSFTRAIEINPKNWQAYNNRGITYGSMGKLDLAIADYNKAIEINPDNADSYSNRAAAWFYKGQWASALADCSKTLSLDPGRTWSQNQLAWILATCPEPEYRNGKKALELVKKALDAEDNFLFYDTLAAAYAECGEFDKAVGYQTEALERLQKKEEVPQDTLEGYQNRLAFYKAGRPWRIGFDQPHDGQSQGISASASQTEIQGQDQGLQEPETARQDISIPAKSEPESVPAQPLPATFSIQAGAFLSSTNAEKQEAYLKSKGYPARVYSLQSASGKIWNLVLIGEYETKEEAKSAAGDLTARENIATAIFPMDLR